MENRRRIAIMTAGGDCPGMNVVIRAVAKKAILEHGYDVIGIEDGYEGLVSNHYRTLSFEAVSGIVNLGGTILGTSNTVDPYAYAVKHGDQIEHFDRSQEALQNIEKLGIECLVCVGGDGSLTVAKKLAAQGARIVGVPKTIDNDVMHTDITVGFDTALSVATDGIDRVHTSAQSHHRAMIVEVMGRNAGWLALYSGIAGGGDIIIIPEIPYDIDAVVERVKERHRKGKRFTIIVISEGARPIGGNVVVKRIVKTSAEPVRLGGISFALAGQIEQITGLETRALVMGHLLRGGPPTAFDRVLATRLGARAMDLVMERQYGNMVAVKGSELVEVPFDAVADAQKTVPLDSPMISAARTVGTSFGEHA